MIGIYKIVSPRGLIYVGKSVNIEKRWSQYRSGNSKGQPKLHASFLLYGVDRHTFTVLKECSFEELHNNESYFINHFESHLQLNCHKMYCSDKIRIQKAKPKDWKEYLKMQLLKNPLPIDHRKIKLKNAAIRRALYRSVR